MTINWSATHELDNLEDAELEQVLAAETYAKHDHHGAGEHIANLLQVIWRLDNVVSGQDARFHQMNDQMEELSADLGEREKDVVMLAAAAGLTPEEADAFLATADKIERM